MARGPSWKRIEVTEKAFKRLTLLTTLLGLLTMAAGLNQLVTHGRWLPFLALFALGGGLASVTVWIVRPRDEPGFIIELYVREGCTLCEEPAAWLAAKTREYGYDVWERDVDTEPALAAQYGDHVPVAVLDGKEELFRLSVDYAALERRLARRARARLER